MYSFNKYDLFIAGLDLKKKNGGQIILCRAPVWAYNSFIVKAEMSVLSLFAMNLTKHENVAPNFKTY